MYLAGVGSPIRPRMKVITASRASASSRSAWAISSGLAPGRGAVLVDVGHDVIERQPLRVFLAPLVERRADRLGLLKAGDVVAAVAAELAERFAADVHFQLVVIERRGQLALVGVAA